MTCLPRMPASDDLSQRSVKRYRWRGSGQPGQVATPFTSLYQARLSGNDVLCLRLSTWAADLGRLEGNTSAGFRHTHIQTFRVWLIEMCITLGLVKSMKLIVCFVQLRCLQRHFVLLMTGNRNFDVWCRKQIGVADMRIAHYAAL